MKCPECEKEITKVNVYSMAVQEATLDGNKIKPLSYETPEVLNTNSIECLCGADITALVEE